MQLKPYKDKKYNFKNKTILKLLMILFIPFTIFLGAINHFSGSMNNFNGTKKHINMSSSALDSILGEGSNDSMKFTSVSQSTSSLVTHDDNGDHLYMWGQNASGQQGNGQEGPSVNKITEVTNLTKQLGKDDVIKQVSISNLTSSVVVHKADGSDHLYMWGNDTYGQQGNGENDVSANVPTEVTVITNLLENGDEIKQITMSQSTSSAVIHNNTGDHLYMWGDSKYYQQGNSSDDEVTTPKEIKGIKDILKNDGVIKKVSLSDWTSSVVIQNDTGDHLYMWGDNRYKQQGVISEGYKIPTEVQGIKDILANGGEIKNISMSNWTSSTLIHNNTGDHLYMWGDNRYSQQGVFGIGYKTPTQVKGIEDILKDDDQIKQISTSNKTSSVLIERQDGKDYLYMWGNNKYGQQGNNAKGNNVISPKEVKLLTSKLKDEDKINQVLISNDTSSAIIKTNRGEYQLYMWGYNMYGQQGNKNKNVDNIVPTKIKTINLPNYIKETKMSAWTSSAIIHNYKDNKDHLYMWGDNTHGQQGNGTKSEYYDHSHPVKTPTEVTRLTNQMSAGDKIKQISISKWTSSVVIHKADRKDHLYMWGSNWGGQQGNGTTSDFENPTTTPTEVTRLTNKISKGDKIKQISMSERTSSAIIHKEDGTDHLYMWGGDDNGQQGNNGKQVQELTPTEVTRLTNQMSAGDKIKQISMSDWTSSALIHKAKDNTDHLYMWGNNMYAQQGNGTISDNEHPTTTPTEVTRLTNKISKGDKIKQISMSKETSSTVIRKVDGTDYLYMWGSDGGGQQGRGEEDYNVVIPKEVTRLTDKLSSGDVIKQISMSERTSSAVIHKADGSNHLYMWGYNTSSQQGNGEYGGDIFIPTEVTRLTNQMSAGDKIKQISMSYETSSALIRKVDGTVHLYMWGDNLYAQQGNGTSIFHDTVKSPTEMLQD